MKREDILGRIGSILDEMKTECRSLYIQPTINALELELFEANAKFLQDHVQILKKIVQRENPEHFSVPATAVVREITPHAEKTASAPSPIQQQPALQPTTPPEVPPHQPKPMPAVPEIPPPTTPPIQPSKPQEIPQQPTTPVVPALIETPPELVRKTTRDLEHDEAAAWAAINARFQKAAPNLNDSMARDKPTALNAVIQRPPVGDLKKAIGVNDKFAFIRGLFNNSVDSFEQAVNKLNACTSFEEASLLIRKEYAIRPDWEKRPELVETFLGIIKKRF